MSEEILEGQVTAPILTDAEEQAQPETEETSAAEQEEKSETDFIHLCWLKLQSIQEDRYTANQEAASKGARLLSSPYDSLFFEDEQEFGVELLKIRNKTSRLSRSKRDALMMLSYYVAYDLSNAEPANKDDAEADVANPETTEEKPAAETVTE